MTAPPRPISVLLVDDSVPVQERLGALLEEHPHLLVAGVARTARSALDQLRSLRPDAMVLDIQLPDRTGIEVLREMRRDGIDCRTVVLTNQAVPEMRERCIELGAHRVFDKSLEFEHVPEALLEPHPGADPQTADVAPQAATAAPQDPATAALAALSSQVAIVDARGILRYANPAWERFAADHPGDPRAGRTGDDILDRCRRHRGASDAFRSLADGLHEVATGARQMLEVEYAVTPPSGMRWFLLSAAVLRQAGGGMVITCIDVTDRRIAEDRVQELFRILDQARESIVIRDLEGRVRYVNKGCERLTGWTLDDIAGLNIHKLVYRNPAHAEAAQAAVLETGAWQGEITLLTKGGSEIVVDSRWTLARSASGEPESVIIIALDITDRKRLEAQFLRAQRLENLGILASGIAHDLNNVLAPILLGAPLLAEVSDAEERRHWAGLIESSAHRATGVIRQLLAFGRGTEGQKVPVQPRHIVRDLTRVIRETFPASIRVEDQTATELWPVVGDATQIQQVLLNLAVNARDAMPEGGRLVISGRNVELDEIYASMDATARPGAHVCIEVKDTGQGIPADYHERIFEPFFTTKETHHGSGLGLATTRAIVRDHGGFLRLDSAPGRGSTFSVFLPATPDAVPAPAAAREKAPRGNGELILLADDERAIREATERALKLHGYRVLLSSDGAEAISLFARHHTEIGATIVDLAMPLLDGLAFMRAARRISPTSRFIVSTGSPGGGAHPRLAEDEPGLAALLVKPHGADALLHALHNALHPQPA